MFYENVCSAEQMRKTDADAVQSAHIPSILLMENAAAACAGALGNVVGKRAVIFCGRGNNGGDGLAIARRLYKKGAAVIVILVCSDNFSGDALINYNILRAYQDDEFLKIINYSDTDVHIIDLYTESADFVIDAIYGTGLHGEITGNAKTAVNTINSHSRFTLSVDIPSGINADTGEICGVCVNADVTVTFAAYKKGLLLYPGAEHTGKIILDHIMIPENIIKSNNTDNTFMISRKNLLSLMPERTKNSHKGDYGKILIIGGSVGMSGAPVMAAQAALMSGGGLITAAVPEKINPVMENKLTEVMSIPLEDFHGNLTVGSIGKILEKANSCDAVLFGVGIGRSGDIAEILAEIIKNYNKTLIIDADGLFALSQNMQILYEKKCEIILTPHSGEFARINGTAAAESGRIDAARALAQKYGVTTVLKGSHTVIASAGGNAYINTFGNAGMASGGSGDVLAGMITAFAARGLSPAEACILAVGLHGIAGDIDMQSGNIESVCAEGIIKNIPRAFALINGNIKI